MVFLGVVSLAGMVIKNAIVWVEFVEQARGRGTVLFESMAWSMIAGLSRATLLTLVVIPVFYSLLLPNKHELRRAAAQGC